MINGDDQWAEQLMENRKKLGCRLDVPTHKNDNESINDRLMGINGELIVKLSNLTGRAPSEK